MKKFRKYSSLFFALYNFFLVIVAIFNIFNFSNDVLRILLALEALHVTICKLFEYLDDKRPDPVLNKTINIKTAPASIIHLKETSIEHKEVYQEFSETIKKNLARNLGERMFNDNLITFTVQEEIPNCVTTTAEVKVVADCGGTQYDRRI